MPSNPFRAWPDHPSYATREQRRAAAEARRIAAEEKVRAANERQAAAEARLRDIEAEEFTRTAAVAQAELMSQQEAETEQVTQGDLLLARKARKQQMRPTSLGVPSKPPAQKQEQRVDGFEDWLTEDPEREHRPLASTNDVDAFKQHLRAQMENQPGGLFTATGTPPPLPPAQRYESPPRPHPPPSKLWPPRTRGASPPRRAPSSPGPIGWRPTGRLFGPNHPWVVATAGHEEPPLSPAPVFSSQPATRSKGLRDQYHLRARGEDRRAA